MQTPPVIRLTTRLNGHQPRIYINHNELFKDLMAQSQRGRKLSSETFAGLVLDIFGNFSDFSVSTLMKQWRVWRDIARDSLRCSVRTAVVELKNDLGIAEVHLVNKEIFRGCDGRGLMGFQDVSQLLAAEQLHPLQWLER